MTQQLDISDLSMETQEEDEVARKIQEQLELLNDHYTTISAMGGVGREQVQLMVRDCAMTLPENYPSESFTLQPSKTNYGIAMESIGQTAWTLIVDLIKKAAEILRKILKYITDLFKQAMDAFKDWDKVKNNVSVLAKGRNKIKSLAGTVEVSGEQKERLDTYTAKLEEINGEYARQWTGLIEDVVTNGPLTRTVRLTLIPAEHTLNLLSKKMQLLIAVNDQTTSPEYAITRIQRVAEPIDPTPYESILSLLGVHDKQLSIYDVAQRIKEGLLEAMSNHGVEGQTLSNVIDRLVADHTSPGEVLINKDVFYRKVHSFDDLMAKLQESRPKGAAGTAVGAAYAHAFNMLSSEFTAVSLFVSMAKTLNDMLFRVYRTAEAYVYNEYMAQVVIAESVSDLKEREEIQRELSEVRAHLQRIG